MKKILLFFCVFFILTPLFADNVDDDNESNTKDLTQIFHLYRDVDLVPAVNFQYDKHRIVIKEVFPQLESDKEDPSIDGFNDEVKKIVLAEAENFKNDVTKNLNHMQNIDAANLRNNLYIDFDTSSLISGDYHLVSIRFSIQGMLAGMAHPYHIHRVLNYNLDDNDVLSLSDLFIEDSDYLKVISNYVRSKLLRHLPNAQMVMDGTAPIDDNFKNWNIKPDGLLFTFDEYQVAPYVNGPQTVLVPYSILKPLVDKESPIIGCVKHTRRCFDNNVLTGGFIDLSVDTNHRRFNPILSKL